MADTNKNSNISALFIVAAVLLISAFLYHRGQDAGQLTQLISAFGGGAVFGQELFSSVWGAVCALLILTSWIGAGHFVVSLLKFPTSEDRSHILELALKAGVGAAVWSLIWFVLGLAGLYSSWVATLSVVIGQVLFAMAFWRAKEIKQESRVPESATLFDKVLMFLAVFPVGLSFVAALAPPIAKDTLLYHFSVPKHFIAQGSSAFIEGNIASYLSLGTEMHVVWAMLLGEFQGVRGAEAAGGGVVWLFFPLLLAAIFGIARELNISRSWSLIAVLMVATIPTAFHVASSGYVDLALSLYVLLGVYSLIRLIRSGDASFAILTGVFLGAALSIKLTTLFVIAAVVLVLLLALRDQSEKGGDISRTIKFGAGAILLAGVIASPWYLRTWVETGSPIFPFYMNIWEGRAKGWDVERSNLFQMMNSQYGGYEKNALDYVISPWNISVVAQPENAAYFDGVLGVAFLLGALMILFALWKLELSTEVKTFLIVSMVMYLFWLFTSQQLRYLLPIVPLLAISTGFAGEAIADRFGGTKRWLEIVLAASSAAALLVTFAWFLQKAPVMVVLGGETRDEYLTRNLDYYEYYKWLNTEAKPEEKVWLINMRRDSYNLDRPYFSDYLFEDITLKQLLWASNSADEMRAAAKQQGFNYILVRHDFLLDYKLSSVLDDAKSEPENQAKLKILQAFIADKQNTVKADKKFSLIRVF